MAHILGGGFKYLVVFIRIPGEMIQCDEHILQLGGKKPPTSIVYVHKYHVCWETSRPVFRVGWTNRKGLCLNMSNLYYVNPFAG